MKEKGKRMGQILVVGSIGFDTIQTPEGKVDHILGGSANYFSLAASLYSNVRVVGVVGRDYADEHLAPLRQRQVDVTGIEHRDGKTFHWTGSYQADMNEATTLATELNVLQTFNPILPASYHDSETVFLANIDPELQIKVLDQVKAPKLIGCDTMNYWIKSKLDALKTVLKRVHVLLVNEGEARMLTGKPNAIAACEELTKLGPKAVVIKRGEYGFVLYSAGQYFILPAFPIAHVIDPTGAGDTFAGGFFGYLARLQGELNFETLKQACVHGCLLASFTVENFGIANLESLDWTKVEKRHDQYRRVISL
jgi:sugar/nucleoside kinase (ribokinase family)